MAANTRSSASNSRRKSSEAKSTAGAVANGSAPKRSRAGNAAKPVAAGSSDTTTSIGQSIEELNIDAATSPPPHTKPNDDSGNGGVPAIGSGARIVSVFKVGPFTELALVVMPVEEARQMATDTEHRGVVVEGVVNDLASIREAAAPLADSALAGSAITLALAMENPYNSATSKSMCANSLLATMNRLNELLPPKQETSALDDLRARREARRAAARETGT